MLNLTLNSSINDILPYLLGILGLLMTWELHDLEVRAGRIKGLDISDPAAIRSWLRSCWDNTMYVYATPNDAHACEPCRKANHTVFSSTLVRRGRKFHPLASPCVNPAGCRCLVVGLVGDWPVAQKLLTALRHTDDATALLTDMDMAEFLTAGQAARDSADCMGIYLLQALRAEGAHPQFAISRYRQLIMSTTHGIDHPFVIPAYLRLSDLLERAGRSTEALDVLDDFYTTVLHKKGRHAPSAAQTTLMFARRARLLRRLRNSYRLSLLPTTSSPS